MARGPGGRGARPGGPRRPDHRAVPNLDWHDTDLGALLPGDLPLTVDNKANFGGLAELWLGDATPRDFLHVSAEIGIGAAVVVDGRLLRGTRSCAGELGHVPVWPDGPPCPCGGRGCLEQYAGEEAVLRAAGLEPREDRVGLLTERAARGDAEVRRALRDAGTALGIALTGAVNLVDIRRRWCWVERCPVSHRGCCLRWRASWRGARRAPPAPCPCHPWGPRGHCWGPPTRWCGRCSTTRRVRGAGVARSSRPRRPSQLSRPSRSMTRCPGPFPSRVTALSTVPELSTDERRALPPNPQAPYRNSREAQPSGRWSAVRANRGMGGRCRRRRFRDCGARRVAAGGPVPEHHGHGAGRGGRRVHSVGRGLRGRQSAPSVLIALVACLFTASCVAELARRLPTAGSVATYAAQGLHPAVGFLVGWGYVFVEALVPPLLLLQLGFTTAGTLHQQWSSYPDDLWWPWSLAGAAIMAVAGYFGVRASARFGTVLGVFEVLVFLVFAIWLIAKAGSDNTLSVFGTSHTAEGYEGVSGVFAGSVYTVLAFAGFEAAAPLAEETKDPRRTMHRAVLGAALGIGLFYVLTTYAMSVYFGPDRWGLRSLRRGVLGRRGPRFLRSVLGAGVPGGGQLHDRQRQRLRDGLDPYGLRPGPDQGVPAALRARASEAPLPVAGVAAQCGVAVAAVLGLGLYYDPVTAFLLLATVIVTVVIGVYIVVNLACAGYFLRRRRELLEPGRHLLFPLLGIVAFVPALLTAAGLPVFDFVSELTAPVSYAGPVVGVWMAAGVVVLIVLSHRHPGRVAGAAVPTSTTSSPCPRPSAERSRAAVRVTPAS